MVDVPVNGRVLEWARRERQLSIAEAAERLEVTSATISDLENGEVKPTLGMLRSMATKYELPLATLLMPEPLPSTQRPAIVDHRTFDGVRPEYSHKLQMVIEGAWETVDALSDLKSIAPDLVPDSSEIPHVSPYVDMEEVAASERARIGCSVGRQIGLSTAREAFFVWRHAVEEQGVFVTVANAGGDDNCRGFAINDERHIPYIFINSDESGVDRDYRSRSFGLLHEYCHVMMRQNALSDHGRTERIEAACNTFAAFFLMPRDEFNAKCRELAVAGQPTEWHITRLANTFHTSLTSVGYHLESTGNARKGFGDWFRRELRKRNFKDSSGRAAHHEKLANRLGGNLVRVILDASARGLLNKIDVHELTNIKPIYYEAVRGEIDARAEAYGIR